MLLILMINMRVISGRIKGNQFLKNMAVMTMGTVLGQVIIVGVSPLLTRIYLPSQLGAFTLVLTLVTLFTPIVNGRYDISIVVAENEKEANSLVIVGVLISVIVSLLIGLGIFVYSIISPTTFQDVGIWLYLVIPMLIIVGITNVLLSYNNRHSQYKLIASVNLIRSFVQATTQVIFGLLGFGTPGLIISQLISLSFAIKKQAKYASKHINNINKITRNNCLDVIKKFKNQPLYSAPALFINSFSNSILIFMITYLYGIKEVGYYAIAYRVLGLPITVITANVARIFYERAHQEMKSNGNFYNIFKKTALLLFAISVPFFLLLAFTPTYLYELVFGNEWGRVGVFVAILTPMYAIKFIVSSLSLSLVIGNKQKVELLLQIGFIVNSIIAFGFSKIMKLEIEYFLSLVSTLYFINYLIVLIVILRLSKMNGKIEN